MSAVKNKILFFISIIFCLSENAVAQQDDSLMLRKIYNEILVNGKAYDWLSDLTKTVAGRLSGSPQAAEAGKWTEKKKKEAGADISYMQKVKGTQCVRCVK